MKYEFVHYYTCGCFPGKTHVLTMGISNSDVKPSLESLGKCPECGEKMKITKEEKLTLYASQPMKVEVIK